MNAFHTIIEILLAIVLLFFCPVLFFAEKQDTVIEQKVIAETSYFIDSIRNSGTLTKQMYDQFSKKLSLTGQVYEIELEHYHVVYYANEDTIESVDEFKGDKRYELHTTKSIMADIYEKEIYTFNQGDYITISLIRKNQSLAERIQRSLLILPMDYSNRTMYGGLIRNETY